MIILKKILCPVDHSECSYLALKYAISLALKDEAKLYLMHVIDTRLYDTEIYKFSPYKIDEVDIDMSKIREDLMKSLPEGTTDVLDVETIIVKGVPFHEIVNAAAEISADIIVIGTHGRTGLSHVVMGSVAEKVVRKATCPVLTVRMPPQLSATN
ncbi:MAG: universal stress protein [Candidatus Brocadia sp. AMX2]|uniref:Universal stress protein n=1 Tax=Candidatus Brocadia sinica JPN1 TaxID=1197129 RepID=A0ABQ0JSI7_9BACT|nr:MULTISPECIES: universal stress protein [Brocadia]KXK28161.1 MAG: putative universal stress protein [Candidatus Brocadia sinica]MBC6931329.1 universal stress protein [Candidatus Brocadia sp.]MBL1168676.1 universal stress protein [Candidatus Brocadia sp. AMX1]NOG43276.1 universal stress protein [Planctomycetota bacterium]KAA0245933.1 MAG: universal stress protein [Candidatus Brocadia sp. AMX2]